MTLIRQWVAAGHGFIGIGEPTATAQPYQGRRFQLADVLGVDQELAFHYRQIAIGISRWVKTLRGSPKT